MGDSALGVSWGLGLSGADRGSPEPAVPGYPGATMFHHFFL